MPLHVPANCPIPFEQIKTNSAAIKNVKTQTHDASIFESHKLALGCIGSSNGDASQALRFGRERLQEKTVVAAVNADLRQAAISHSGCVEHRKIPLKRRFRRRIAASGYERVGWRQADNMAVRIGRALGNFVARWLAGVWIGSRKERP